MSAFDDMERTDIEPASHLIGPAEYLNASGAAGGCAGADFIEQLLEQYPAGQARRPGPAASARGRTASIAARGSNCCSTA